MSTAASTANPFDPYLLGMEAYVYLYPLVIMETTRRQMTNLPPDAVPGHGPMNTFAHIRAFPTADFRAVVRPNFDTLYSLAWLDLSRGPVVVTAPDTDGRYYGLGMYDMWTNAFASPGWRTSGTDASHWGVTPPGWSGTLPQGVRAIPAPTPIVWVIGRTQTNGPDDYAAVHDIQDGYAVTPLDAWETRAVTVPAPVDPSVDMDTEPLQQVNSMTTAEFLSLGAHLMGTHRPALTDWSVLERIAHIGIVPGHPFDPTTLGPDALAALASVPLDAQKQLRALVPTMARVANGWSMNTDTMGVYGNFYLKRAIFSMIGLGASAPEDAVYPLQIADAEGKPATGDRQYVLRFAAGQLPPVDAFWSVTLYDQEGYQVPNSLNRFALGDRDPLIYATDGSLTLYVQADAPSADLTANWLPTPAGPFSLCMRLYAPRPAVLDGRWNPPPLTAVARNAPADVELTPWG